MRPSTELQDRNLLDSEGATSDEGDATSDEGVEVGDATAEEANAEGTMRLSRETQERASEGQGCNHIRRLGLEDIRATADERSHI